jgi:ketosteroid isomerase-like protein
MSLDAGPEVANGPLATPRECVHAFAAALGHGDLATAVNCLAPEVTLITPDATSVSGCGTVRGVLAQLIAAAPKIAFEFAAVIEAGPVAFAQQRWRISSELIAGSPHLQTLNPSFVVLRDGIRWHLAILAPWGWAGSSIENPLTPRSTWTA